MACNRMISTAVLLMLLSTTIPAFAQRGEGEKHGGGGNSPQRQHESQPQHAQQSQHQSQPQPSHQAQRQAQPRHSQQAQRQVDQPRRQEHSDAYNRSYNGNHGNNSNHGNNGNHGNGNYGRISNANYS